VTSVIERAPTDMPAGSIALTAAVFNGHSEPVVVGFAPEQRDNLALEVTPSMITLLPGQRATLRVTGSVTTVGKHAVFLRGTVSDTAGLQLAETVLDMHMRVTRDATGALRATLADFTTLFVDEGAVEVPGIGLTYPAQRGIPAGREIPEDGSREPRGLPEELAPRSATFSTSAPTTMATQQLTVKGQFRWVDSTGLVRPAVGWRAALYYWNGSQWVDSGARSWVYSNASYSVTGTVPLAAWTRVTLFPSNRYFDIVNGKGTKYNFSLPQFSTDEIVYDYGGYYLKKDAVPGLGELHSNAYDLWVKLYKAEVDPLRTNPIKVVYPGTDDCGSCTLNGTVHIEAAKGTNFHTIRHELGHELMYQYWGDMPSGSGGYHEWPKCYNGGMALSEGFAHFVSWWSTVNRTTLAGSWGTGYNGESLPDTVCKGIATNELRVAATFWDLHDHKIDGVDDFSYLYDGTILRAILLDGAVYSSLPGMIGRLEDYAGSEWEKVEDVAEQNFTDPK
jgi:hypothetical protein